MKQLFIGIALTLTCAMSNAGTIGVHTVSYHTDRSYNWNEKNAGLYYRTDDGYQIGAYYNSVYKPTVYAAKVFEMGSGLSIAVGGATGYKEATGLAIVPVIAAKVQFGNVGIIGMPTYRTDTKKVGLVFNAVLEF